LRHKPCSFRGGNVWGRALAGAAFALLAGAAFAQGPVRISLDDAIRLALQHNHTLLAARTTIEQSKDQEITANLRPNPALFGDWDYLPLFSPSNYTSTYLNDLTEADLGLSYLIERGKKRQRRLQAAKDQTAVTTDLVSDNERTLTFQVATLFINVQLAESTLELAQKDLESYQKTVDLNDLRYQKGAISEDDKLKIELQLLQFQNDVAQAELAKVQGLSDLRQALGYEAVPATYDVAGAFEYQKVQGNLEDLQLKALQQRPDLRAATQGVTAATSQWQLAKADGKQDVTVQGNYTHNSGINGASFYASMPLPIFNRNQGEIARTKSVIVQSQEQEKAANNQVMTDVRDAYENLQTSDKIVTLYQSGYLDRAQKDRDISEYAYQRGAVSLLDFLDAERSYRATQLAYRQALAAWLLAVEQLREAVGTRSLP
jgi:cobalt-zinc-cadmium efflux system outer membrane protein